MSRGPAARLLRTLARSAEAAGCAVTLAIVAETPWASVTFTGARYQVAARGAGLESWLAALSEVELPMPGGFVADCAVVPLTDGAMLTVLVLDG